MRSILKKALCVVALILPSGAIAEKIQKINISDNQRIESSTISEYSGVKIGGQYSDAKANDIMKKLYDTALFEDINIQFRNGTLIIKVQETPFVSHVAFTGNYKVKTTLLANEIQTSPGENLRKNYIVTDLEKIKEIYKRSGRFATSVKSKVEKQENNRVKVIFDIVEGPKTGVNQIYFAGNNHYKDSELKSVIMTKESRWFRFLETNDTYDPDRIEFDKQMLTRFYNSIGFADFRVISVNADLLPTKEGFIITYSIDEGKKYKFGKITLDNKLPDISNKEVWKFIQNREGEVSNLGLMERVAEGISEYLAGKGYPQVSVYPDVKINRNKGTVDITIVIDHADKVFINKINIEGNVKTEDNVIRRQIKISEGDIYNRTKIDNSERNIRNLDYFGLVNFRMSPTKKRDRYDLDIEVAEKSTASFGFDLGYNTSGGPFAKISFLERNLVGTGQHLNAGVQMGKKSTYYYAGLTNPNFLDRDLSLGGSVFRSDNGRGSGFSSGEHKYSQKSMGFKTALGCNITDDLSHDIEYQLKQDDLKSPEDSSSIFIKEQMGKYSTSSISNTLVYDGTDNRMLTKSGAIVTLSQDFAGIGGNTKYLKHDATAKFIKSFSENKYTLQFSTSVGHIMGVGGKKVRISDRFNLGDHSLRGFAHAGIGPRDKATKEGLGGQKYYSASSELSFPVGLPEEFNVTGSLFVDVGSLWDVDSTATTDEGFYNSKSPRVSVGFGVLWVTRIAPIRMDWGFPIKKESYDERQTFHIRFSTHL